ncbi:hypothetical protein B0H66DRAFT_600625 [Apodospora peruviana]|uniref:NACHT domain-containing protein n=1 Tax=Apodospora peruviana TaxID=516989 RepID=A0AAE0MBN1_9PEZI|nr:hypothetical protein B0H66DRAFT_600625 [Apodospora peruviana]
MKWKSDGSSRFGKLDVRIKQFISEQADSCRKLSKQVGDEAVGVKKEVIVQASLLNRQKKSQVQAQDQKDRREKFLKSLQFPTMRQRKARLRQKHIDEIHGRQRHDSQNASTATYNDWSDKELEALLVKGISKSARRICLFLDGLDEIDRTEGPFPLVKLVERVEANTSTKLCLATWPEAEFQLAFAKRRTLRLEDLTRMDIIDYVRDYFQKHLRFWSGMVRSHIAKSL